MNNMAVQSFLIMIFPSLSINNNNFLIQIDEPRKGDQVTLYGFKFNRLKNYKKSNKILFWPNIQPGSNKNKFKYGSSSPIDNKLGVHPSILVERARV